MKKEVILVERESFFLSHTLLPVSFKEILFLSNENIARKYLWDKLFRSKMCRTISL
jgi:hypothetical protein